MEYRITTDLDVLISKEFTYWKNNLPIVLLKYKYICQVEILVGEVNYFWYRRDISSNLKFTPIDESLVPPEYRMVVVLNQGLSQ